MRRLPIFILVLAVAPYVLASGHFNETPAKFCTAFRVVNSTSASNDGQCMAVKDFSGSGGAACGTANAVVDVRGNQTDIKFTDVTCAATSVVGAGSVEVLPGTYQASDLSFTALAGGDGLTLTSADSGTGTSATLTSGNTVSGGPFAVSLQLSYTGSITDFDAVCGVCWQEN